jgi:hypothetical protein
MRPGWCVSRTGRTAIDHGMTAMHMPRKPATPTGDSGVAADGVTTDGVTMDNTAGDSVAADSTGPVAAFRAVLRRHWLIWLLLLAGLVLRVLSQVAYRPALLYIDSVKYLFNAFPGTDPVGYKVPLSVLLFVGNLAMVAAVQHLLGLAMAALLYLVLLRRGSPRWLAALAAAPVLLDAYQLQMEQTIMPDVWFEAAIAGGLVLLLWRPRPTLPMIVAAGLVLGSAAPLRQVGEILIVPAVAYVAIVTHGWRQRITLVAVVAAAFAVPVLTYNSVSYAQNGHFRLSHSGSSQLYGRMAADANCATLTVAPYEQGLCPTPQQQARGPDSLEHSTDSPLKTYTAPVTRSRSAVISNFDRRVLEQQPLRIIVAIGRDAAKLFAVDRVTSRGDTPISRWQFQTHFPTYSVVRLGPGNELLVGGQATLSDGGAPVLTPMPASMGRTAAVSRPLAQFLRFYQLHGGYTPGPLLALATITGLIGAAVVARRRRDTAERSMATACFLFFVTAVAVLGVSDLFEFSWRYQLPALVTLPPAGALGLSLIAASVRHRRGAGSSGARPGEVTRLAAPAR